MAICHGLAGQYSKGQSNQRTMRVLVILLTAAGYGLGGLGFAFGYFLAHWGPWLALVGLLGVAGAGFLIWRPFSRHIDKTAKDRIRLMRGGQGEALVAAILIKELEDDWHVFNA
jgi:membrane protein implicated in regulation of membrane protease activity